jgi:hypothetical protein
MNRKIGSSFLAIVFLAGSAAPVVAHHSFAAEFDGSKTLTLTGTITKMDWMNPHTYLYIDVKGDGGEMTSWNIESYPTGTLRRAGVTRSMFVVGQSITVQINPAKDGTKSLGSLRHVKFQNGNEINFKNISDPSEANPSEGK